MTSSHKPSRHERYRGHLTRGDMMDHYAAASAAATGSGMPSIKRPVIRVKNISISDVYTHQIIFQRVYTWKATTAFSNLGNLIESFYQFARTVDDGAVVGIDFESTGKDNLRKRRDDSLWDVRGDTMHMMTLKTSDFTATAFYDLAGRVLISHDDEKKFKIFLHTVTIAFEHMYLDTLRTIRNQHQMLCKQHPDEAIMMNTGIFADFMSMVDGIHDLVFNHPLNAARPPLLMASPLMPQPPPAMGARGMVGHGPAGPMSMHMHGMGAGPPPGQGQGLRDEHQLEHWLQQRSTPQPLSVEEEVRNVLENINIFLPEIVLDRFAIASNPAGGPAANGNPSPSAVQGGQGMNDNDF